MSHSFYLPFFYLVLKYVHIICNRLRRTPKSFSHRFLGSNTRFVSIMVTNPKNAILRFVFSKLPRVKGKMDISWDNQKCPKNGGIIILRRFWPSADLHEKKYSNFKRNIFGSKVLYPNISVPPDEENL